jgi:6-phosphofructokinase 1
MGRRAADEGQTTSERRILQSHIADRTNIDTEVARVEGCLDYPNPIGEEILGLYRPQSARKAVIADVDILDGFRSEVGAIPSFLEAGPRAQLCFDPRQARAAIVTTGGLAPGLHCVIHSIVKRHWNTYSMDMAHGRVFGVYNSFRGLRHVAGNRVELSPAITEGWLDQGGSKLGCVRYFPDGRKDPDGLARMVGEITKSLELNDIHILYVLGGDGSLKVAHDIARANPTRSVVGIPKTMDNDILWVWQSFGFNTAVEQATRVVNTLHNEAESTRRICVVELFGADSGFVAANATLASGHVDLVLIPEVFNLLSAQQAVSYLDQAIEHLARTVRQEPFAPHALVVVAEGVGKVLETRGVSLAGGPVTKDSFPAQFIEMIKARVVSSHGHDVQVNLNQPRHHVRAVPANAHDQIYCERLGALAVDNALGGYTDFMISQWLTEFVLVPLHLVGLGRKSIPVNGMFWKQVVSTTGQPLSPAEWPSGHAPTRRPRPRH